MPDLLEEMAKTDNQEYLVARNKIIELGKRALPQLRSFASDASLDWRNRLAARICFERIYMDGKIEKFIGLEWDDMIENAIPEHKPFEEEYEEGLKPDFEIKLEPGKKIVPMGGAQPFIKEDFVAECNRLGAWYYFVELNWKQTNETGHTERHFRFKRLWPTWCAQIVSGQPEKIWLSWVLQEKLQSAGMKGSGSQRLYEDLLRLAEPETVPVLLGFFDDYIEQTIGVVEPGSGVWNTVVRKTFTTILSFSLSDHVEELQRVVARHDALTDFDDVIEEIRKRPKISVLSMNDMFRVSEKDVDNTEK